MVQPLRIALISPFPPLKGGIARFSGLLRPALEAAGCEVLPVPFRRLYPRWLLNGRPAADAGDQATLPSSFRLDLMNPLSWFLTARAVRNQRPDLLLVAYWGGLLAPLCAVFRAVTGIRTVALLHNFASHERLPAEALLQRLLLASSDGFITLSSSVREELDSAGHRKPATTLFHPVDAAPEHLPSKPEARKLLGLPSEAKVLLFFGYLRRYKGLDVLLETMAVAHRRDPSLLLVVAGEPVGAAGSVGAAVERLGIAGCVQLLPGYVSADRLAPLFAAADAVVLPYRSATQSGVAPLALSHGVPVIACDAGALPSQVAHGRTGWVVRRAGHEALAEGILEFFRCRGSMPLREGLDEARRAASWQEFASQAASFLDSCAKGAA
ncbi:MAG: glycosyltransferase [Chlorobiaceae bacterium]|nr:glycosyltransferase [Chlorobiaceae bacterium]